MNSIDIYTNNEEKLIKEMVSALNMAFSVNVSDDYQRMGLNPDRSNSFHQLCWDHLNDNLSRIEGVLGGYVKRGYWNMYFIFNPQTGTLYSVMKEKRLAQISKELRKNPHYVRAVAAKFNTDLVPTQMSFFPMEPDEGLVNEIVSAICNQIDVSVDAVKCHKLILFSYSGGVIYDVKCCMVDKMLEIHDSVDLTSYINVNEVVVSEDIYESDSKNNHPNQGLKLKPKAKNRIDNRDNLKLKNNENEQKLQR